MTLADPESLHWLRMVDDHESHTAHTRPYSAYWYAKGIGHRYTAGEAMIATDPNYSLLYIKNILKKRWVRAEYTMRADPSVWEFYKKEMNALGILVE